MKIQVELELNISAKALYRDGKVSVSVTGSMPLTETGGRDVSATSEGASKKTLALFQEAFEALITEKQEMVIRQARAGSAEALGVAVRMGEL